MPHGEERVCSQCGRKFWAKKFAPCQTTCGRKVCRLKRRRLWQRARCRNDPEYRENQAAAQKRWAAKHPGYWRTYRLQKTLQKTLERGHETGPPLPCRGGQSPRSSVVPPCAFLKRWFPVLVMGLGVAGWPRHDTRKMGEQNGFGPGPDAEIERFSGP